LKSIVYQEQHNFWRYKNANKDSLCKYFSHDIYASGTNLHRTT